MLREAIKIRKTKWFGAQGIKTLHWHNQSALKPLDVQTSTGYACAWLIISERYEIAELNTKFRQAGAELGQAQVKLEVVDEGLAKA